MIQSYMHVTSLPQLLCRTLSRLTHHRPTKLENQRDPVIINNISVPAALSLILDHVIRLGYPHVNREGGHPWVTRFVLWSNDGSIPGFLCLIIGCASGRFRQGRVEGDTYDV